MARNGYHNLLACLSFLFLFFTGELKATDFYYCEEDRVIFACYLSAMKPNAGLSAQELIIETALFFLHTPYVGATLEKEPEELTVNLREMDCTTFVENVISLTKTIRDGEPSFEKFCRNLQQLRYRKGKITGYTARLHYTTDWIYENERKGLIRDITKEAGGKPLPLNLSFMSEHPESYGQLKDNAGRIAEIREKEKEISARSCYYYIPKTEIDSLAHNIMSGDMIGFVTTIDGLDLSHVGIAYRENGKLTFIHASTSAAKSVIINEEPLSAYVKRIKTNRGIMIVRLLP
ncbi:MAG: DUF1460 domain-containing protein [Tannerellaceae bacterium]|jgi:hypothetical protein|nr:DUF1460 domain-containing protein [Tannerellaceae bacterium]